MMRWSLLAVLFLVTCYVQAQDKPNVVVIMADDLGYEDLGFQGSPKIKTPHLDALAKAGIIFTDAHTTASVCAPSRAGFMIGRYQQRAGFEANIPPNGKGLDISEYTFGQAMQSQGYKTYICGKWHIGKGGNFHAMDRGFDEYIGNGLVNGEFREAKGFFPTALEHNREKVKVKGHKTNILTDYALKMIEKDKDKPFFLFMSYFAPHTPLQAPKDEIKKANGNVYHAMVQNMDRNVGRIVDQLKKDGRYENTIFWFLSDNGGSCAQSRHKNLNGKKGLKLEGGQRVPFTVTWPKRIKGGQVFDGLTSSMDIFATSFALAGGTTTPKPLDGKDLSPYILDGKQGDPHEALFWKKEEGASVRVGDFKLMRIDGLDTFLFNLKDDIGETKDLAKSNPEKTQELLKMLEKWEAELKPSGWGEGARWKKVRIKMYKKYLKL